jgi:hypothetical protein
VLVTVAALVVITISCAVHGAVGFGMNLLAVPVLEIIDPAFVPGPALVAGLLLSALMVVREPMRLERRIGWAVAGLVPGTLLATALLAAVSPADLAIPIGVLVLVAVGLSAIRIDLSPNRTSLTVAGAASGFLATAASVGGPPMALLYSRSEGARLRSNLSVFFVITATFSLVALLVTGHFDAHQFRLSVELLPGVLVGFAVSGPLRRVVDRAHVRPSVLALSALAGLIAIAQGVAR